LNVRPINDACSKYIAAALILGAAISFYLAFFHDQDPYVSDILAIEDITNQVPSVKSSEKLTGRFKLINQGKESVEIMDVLRSCSCTSITLDNEIIEPGKWSILEYSNQLQEDAKNYKSNLVVLWRVSKSADVQKSRIPIGGGNRSL